MANALRTLLLLSLLLGGNLYAQSIVVITIEDGDTLLVEVDGKQERLQLAGIDAPEVVENAKLKRDLKVSGLSLKRLIMLGQLATTHLHRLVKPGDQLHLIGTLGQRDRYGRITAQVHTDQPLTLSARMVSDGYAVALRRHAPDATLKAKLIKMEQIARDRHQGLWAEQHADMMAWSGRKP
ncbi:MAG: thermonuclease family protein [Candidatus Polarisedimenticolaceae bacterium]|nr:thermonuclease family protein [Candidatus Polarisedimenticolaceae bacterium]